MRPLEPLRNVADAAGIARAGTRGLLRSGMMRPRNPVVAAGIARQLRKWGTTPGLGFALGAVRDPEGVAIIDVDDPEHDAVTFAEIEHRSTVLANSLLDRGAGPGSAVGILGRNSHNYAETIVAVSRTGADLVYLNTGASPDQVQQIVAAQGITTLIRDEEFRSVCPPEVLTLGLDDPAGINLLDSLPSQESIRAPEVPSRHVILSSGTTGGPLRGSPRTTAPIDSVAALLDAFPLRMGGVHMIACPMFHAWGWMHHRLATIVDATQVLMRSPDPERILALTQAYEVEVLVTVPVVLKRLVDLPRKVRQRYDFSSVTCVAVSGAALPGNLATDFMDAYGDVLYNLYGTTEAAYATVATPGDLRDDPSTAGRPMPGVRVGIYDRKGRQVGKGADGRVFVRSRTSVPDYADSTGRGAVKGMVPTGDIGTIDESGRLRIVGRGDDVIVTGGENVHPTEVEEILSLHPAVREVAVSGRPDPVYGSILIAHVVFADGQAVADDDFLMWARSRLGPHHRPRAVVVCDALPRNSTGKILRRVLSGQATMDDLDEEELL